MACGLWLVAFLAASSSSAIDSIPTFPCDVWMNPSWAISAVRWKPEVFEPSITVFRMTWVIGKILQFRSSAICRVICRASWFILCGGSSSNSTKQFVSKTW